MKNKIQNNFKSNPQHKTHDSAINIEDRYMTFAYICLSTRKINISELNFKRPNITTD